MTGTTTPALSKYEWVEHPVARVRMKFRPDGTGFYEREGSPGTRIVRDNLIYKYEEQLLHLKFAHAREWTQVAAEIRQGHAPTANGRIGSWKLTSARDPYAWTIEEVETLSFVLFSDSGAALLE